MTGLSPEQLELRRMRVGASEIGALLGIDPHRTALDVFAEKTLPPRAREEDDHRQWGLDVESAILRNHARRSGLVLLPSPGTLTHPARPLCCTPDGLLQRIDLTGPERAVQAKNVNQFMSGGWGEPGTDDAPLLYLAQVQMELGVLLARDLGNIDTTADLVAAIAGNPPAAYVVTFDADMFGTLAEVASRFVRDCLIPGREPAKWAENDGALEYLRRRYPRGDGRLLPASDEARALAAALAAAKKAGKERAAEADRLQAELCKLIGDADGLDSIATWKRSRDSTAMVTDWERIARLGVEPSLLAQLIRLHSETRVTRAGSRRLRLLLEEE